MAGDNDNPRIWAGADVYVAPLGTTLPTNTTTALNAGFEALGLLSDEGMTESRNEEQTDHYSWGGNKVRTSRRKFDKRYTVTALEDTPVVFELVNPGSSAVTAGGVTTRTLVPPVTDRRAFVIELTDGTITKRKVIPTGEIVGIGESSISDNALTAYAITIAVYGNETEITDDPQAATAS